MAQDEMEIWFERGVTDGLPVVPPTRERVERMLRGTRRAPEEIVGEIPPNYGRATVQKIAVNAVMAGCRPDYLPVLLAAVEAACDPIFNLHGVQATTHFAAPLIVVNGPVRSRIGLNTGFGLFGPGFRANATTGRALRLILLNLGGARPGEISMSTFGHPGRYTYCIAEHEEASPWEPLHVERGFRADESAVTLFAGEAPHGISDHASRTAKSLAGSLGWSMACLWNAKHFPLYSQTMLLVGPEHARTFAQEGWSKADLKRGGPPRDRGRGHGRAILRGHSGLAREQERFSSSHAPGRKLGLTRCRKGGMVCDVRERVLGFRQQVREREALGLRV